MTMIFLYAPAGAVGVLQLSVAADARLARHGVSAPERASYWIFLFAGIFLYTSFPMGEAPNAGWFNYVPFAGREYNTGPQHRRLRARHGAARRLDHGRLGNFVVTLFRMRAPGMSINRVPIIVWGTLTASVANLSRCRR